MTKTEECSKIINIQQQSYPEILKQQNLTFENVKLFNTPEKVNIKACTGEKICQTEIQYYKS